MVQISMTSDLTNAVLNVIFAALSIDRFTYKSDRAGPKQI